MILAFSILAIPFVGYDYNADVNMIWQVDKNLPY